MGRAPCCDKANVKKGPWSPEEDAKLKAYIHKYGTGGNWIALPQKIGLKRCGKSCRLRWLNYLRPNIKHGGFTEEEDSIICSLYISIGSRWSIIAAQLPGRTDNDIKNYWNTRLKKKLLGRRKQPDANRLPISGHGEDNSFDLQNLSSSALERLQLHLHLQNPFSSFYNNPTLWPKLSHLHHKMIEALNSVHQNQNILRNHPPVLEQDYRFSSSWNDKNELVSSKNGLILSSESSFPFNCKPTTNAVSDITEGKGFTPAEIDDLLNYKSSSSLTLGNDQIAEFDCFKDMDGTKGSNLAWWCDEFDVDSTSPNSWDSSTALHQSEEMNRSYGVGYSME